MKNIKIIRKEIKGSIENNKSLKDFNTWKVGGNAEFFYEPKSLKDLIMFLKLVKDTEITFLGNGSNVLIIDDGIKGCVILSLIHISEPTRPY